jgi:hypothetical protein
MSLLNWLVACAENQVYNEVKKICDCDLGVQSQALVAGHIALTASVDKLVSVD